MVEASKTEPKPIGMDNLRRDIIQIAMLPELRYVDLAITEAKLGDRIFHRHLIGGGFVENTAYVDADVHLSKTSMVLQMAKVFGNPESEMDFTCATEIHENTVISGNARIFWKSYICNAKISGDIELSEATVLGENTGIKITGKGKIEGGKTDRQGKINIDHIIKLDNVSLIGDIRMSGSGLVRDFTYEV